MKNILNTLHSTSQTWQKNSVENSNCRVFLSDVTPRGNYYEGHVHAVNQELTYHLRNTHIKKVDHKNVESIYLYDDRRLRRRNKVNEGE